MIPCGRPTRLSRRRRLRERTSRRPASLADGRVTLHLLHAPAPPPPPPECARVRNALSNRRPAASETLLFGMSPSMSADAQPTTGPGVLRRPSCWALWRCPCLLPTTTCPLPASSRRCGLGAGGDTRPLSASQRGLGVCRVGMQGRAGMPASPAGLPDKALGRPGSRRSAARHLVLD